MQLGVRPVLVGRRNSLRPSSGRYTSFMDSALLLTLGAMLRAALRSP